MFRLRLLALIALLAALGFTCAASSLAEDPRQSPQRGPATAETLRAVPDRPFTLDHIKLDLKVDLEKRTVASKADLTFRTLKPTNSITLDAVGFKVNKIMLGESSQAVEVKFKHDGQKLVIDLGDKWPAGRPGRLNIEYLVDKPRSGLHFFSPSANNPDTPLQVWSQGQTITNRYWFPCIDEPDVRQTTRAVVTVKKGFEAVSNGKLVSRTENADGTVTFDWNQEIPHPSYLVTLVVGEFDVHREEWEGMPIAYYVPKGKGAEAVPSYGRTPAMLTYFSKIYGIRYPWAKYDQVTAFQFGGGMENTSATTMYEGVLRDQRMLFDSNADDFVSHELAHQWWGDMVTCRDWSHLWINEGSATYAEALWEEHVNGRDGYDFTMFQKIAPAVGGGRTRPVMDLRYSHPDSMFDGRSYPKGGWILHMLRRKLGDETFFRAYKEFGLAYKFQSAETGDFRRSFERTSGRSLQRFFYDWLERPGSPALTVTTEYEKDAKTAKIVIKQTQTVDAFHIPIKVALYCAGSKEPVIVEEEMTTKELTLTPTLPGALERVDFDPDLAVLSDVKETKSEDLWKAQLSASAPLRLRAVRHFAEGTPAEHREALAVAFEKETFHAVKTALANLLGSAGENICRDALIAGLKDKDARVRKSCVLNLRKFKNDEAALNAIRAILAEGDPSYGVENACMEVYAAAERPDAVKLITPYLDKGPSYRDTTQLAALNALAATRDPAAFDPLLKWCGADHSKASRAIARRGLTVLIARGKIDEAQLDRAIKSFVSELEKEPGERVTVLNLLPALGKVATTALPVVEKLAQEEGPWQSAAKATAKRLRDLAKPGEEKKPEKK